MVMESMVHSQGYVLILKSNFMGLCSCWKTPLRQKQFNMGTNLNCSLKNCEMGHLPWWRMCFESALLEVF